MKFLCSLAAIIATAAIGIATPASAEMTVREWSEKAGSERQIAEFFLASMSVGMSWTNTMLESEGRSPLYCVPDRLALTEDQIVSIFEDYIAANPDNEDMPIGLILLIAMQHTFPCS